MKKIYIYSILALFFSVSLNAQRCDRYKRYCDKKLYDFDYSLQSAFAHMYPGDTIPVKTVLYSNKEYHITVCSEHPEVNWKIVKPSRKNVKTIKEIVRDTSVTYKVDEYNDYVIDPETGEYVVESTKITVDTVWTSNRVSEEILMFDSREASEWKEKINKTQRAFIYVSIPIDADPDGVCVSVFIGRNALSRSNFNKKKIR